MLNFGDADTTQKATGTTSAQIDFVCVICTSNNSTAAGASLLSLSVSVCLCSRVPHTTISPFLYLPFIFSQLQRSVCTNGIYSRLLQHRYTSFVYYVPVVLLLLLLPLFLPLSRCMCLCSSFPHTTISPFLYLPFYFFAATTKCLYKRHLFPTFLLALIMFRCVTTGLILCTPLTRQNNIFPPDWGMLRSSRRLQIFL